MMQRALPSPLWALALTLIASAYAEDARAADPGRATRVVIHRAPQAPAGLTHRALPERFAVVAEARVEGEILPDPSGDAQGQLVLVSSQRQLVNLGHDGAPIFRRTLPGFPTSRAVVTSDGTRVIATSAGLFGVDPSGEPRFLAQGFAGPIPVKLLTLPDGSLLLIRANEIWKVSARGRPLDRVEFGGPVAEVAHQSSQLLIAAENAVFSWRPPAPPRRVVRTNSAVRSLLPSGRQLFVLRGATTTQTELLEIDLPTRTMSRRWEFEGSFITRYAVLADQRTLSIAGRQLVEHSRGGGELSRFSPVPSSSGPPVMPHVLIDRDGKLALASDGHGLSVIRAGGVTTRQDELSCASYAGLTELAQGYALSCTGGLVRFLRGAQPEPQRGP